MVCERFIGSGRLQEGGFLGTHKQDFEAHRKGCDWRHDADHIDMNPIIPSFPGLNVQETLELISSAIAGDVGLPTVLTINNHAGSNPIIMDMQPIHELQNPTLPQDAATKWYVDQSFGVVNNWNDVLTNGNFSDGIDVNINQGSRIINSTVGGGFTVTLTDNPTGACSPFTFNGGDGYTGSGFTVLGGSSTAGVGGGINLTAGSSSSTGGSVIITAGSGGVSSGEITLNAGAPLNWPNTDGAPGQAIVTDGAGNLSFATFLSGTIDHGSLSGLGDDDHTQYLLINGTRAMTGDLNMGSNDISNCLSVRAPDDGYLVVGSDTMTQTYFQGVSTTTNYLLTSIGNNDIFKDTYYYSIEYSRSGDTPIFSDIPNNGIIKFVTSGKQTVLARHWGGSGDYAVQSELNFF